MIFKNYDPLFNSRADYDKWRHIGGKRCVQQLVDRVDERIEALNRALKCDFDFDNHHDTADPFLDSVGSALDVANLTNEDLFVESKLWDQDNTYVNDELLYLCTDYALYLCVAIARQRTDWIVAKEHKKNYPTYNMLGVKLSKHPGDEGSGFSVRPVQDRVLNCVWRMRLGLDHGDHRRNLRSYARSDVSINLYI